MRAGIGIIPKLHLVTTQNRKSEGRRKRIIISGADERRIFSALERLAKDGDFESLRLRAMVYLLWDGAIGAREALTLDLEDVVADPDAKRSPRIVSEVDLQSERKSRSFMMSDRVRTALLEYLRVAKADGRLRGDGFHGPLFVSSSKVGHRITRHTALDSFRAFLRYAAKVSTSYLLDDVVGTGRARFLQAAEGDVELLAEHAGISVFSASAYREASTKSTRDVLKKLR